MEFSIRCKYIFQQLLNTHYRDYQRYRDSKVCGYFMLHVLYEERKETLIVL